MEQRDIAVGDAASVPEVPQPPTDEPGLRGPNAEQSPVRALVRRQVAAAARAAGSTAPVVTDTRGTLYRTMGEGFTRAFELAVTPALFGAMGYLVDRWLGSMPVFTIILSLLALVGLLLRTWYGYVYRMEALEREGPWARRP